jgi:hypothetical protein
MAPVGVTPSTVPPSTVPPPTVAPKPSLLPQSARAKNPGRMSLLTRFGLAAVVALISFAGAQWLSAHQKDALVSEARLKAQADIDDAWKSVATALNVLPKAVEARAAEAAALPNFSGLVAVTTGHSDVQELAATLKDFRNEVWFQGAVGDSEWAFFIGERLLYSTVPALKDPFEQLLSRRRDGRDQAVVGVQGSTWLLGLARTDSPNKQGQMGFFGLARPLSTDELTRVASSNGVTVQVTSNGAVSGRLAVGDPGGLALLTSGRGAAKVDEVPCCSRAEFVPGVELAVFKDQSVRLEAADAEATRARVPRFGLAGVIALLALLVAALTSRRPAVDAASESLLRETQAQLRQSNEVLQKLSTGAFGTQQAHSLPLASADDPLGSTRASVAQSRYEEVAPLGEGGMATVSIAVVRGAEGFKRTFVLKRLKGEHAANQELVNQFIDEARLGASLVHSNIVPVFDFGRDQFGYYLAQEYILGRDVDHLLEASRTRRGRALEVPVVVAIAQEALKGLAYAHTRKNEAGQPLGLVHRDVSPQNLMVSNLGEVKLLDFGIVKSNDRVTQTQAGVVKGNLFYMSPEQARALVVDARSDLFSLAMVMVTALRGAPLYTGATVYELMTRAGMGPTPEDLDEVRRAGGPLTAFLLKALSIDPALRFTDAPSMLTALTAAAGAATSAEVQALMQTFFAEDFEADRQRFSGAS